MSASARMLAGQFADDYANALAIHDARKAENAAMRARCMASASLCAVLLADARRRGHRAIDWPEYFRNTGCSVP